MRIFLIRHPEPVGAKGLCYGRTDLPVAPDRLESAVSSLRRRLPNRLDAIWTSPLSRCLAVASALSDLLAESGRRLLVDERLMEVDFGDWEASRWDDVDRVAFDRWATDYVHRRPPAGESWAEVQGRVRSFLEELRTLPYEAVGLVSHAGVIRSVLSLVLGVPLESTWRIRIPFGSVAELAIGPDPLGDELVALSGGTPPPV